MAFKENFLRNTNWSVFTFFEAGDPDAAEPFATNISINGAFQLAEIRVGFSGLCSNDIILRMHLSSIEGTEYNLLLLSYALNNSQFYRWQPSTVPMFFQSGDTVQISCLSDNLWHLNVIGWAVGAVEAIFQ